MKLMSFPEIQDCENGQQITALQGTVKKVFEQKSDVGQYGPWHLQNLILQDEHANELTVTWTCEDAFDSGCEGQLLCIESGRDKKDQLAGIKREIKKKGEKTYESVKVDDRAKVKVLNGKTATIPKAEQEADAERMFPPDPRYDTPEKAAATAPESPLRPPNGDAGVMEARKHLMKACNLYNLCIKAAVASICPNIPDEQRTNDQFQSTLASLWIEASSRRCTNGVDWWSFIDKMPDKPL